jgi:hypothetical protein
MVDWYFFILTFILLILPIIELVIYLRIDSEYLLKGTIADDLQVADEPKSESAAQFILDDSKRISSHSLTLLMANVTAIAFLIQYISQKNAMEGCLLILGVGLIYFTISFKLVELSQGERIFYYAQGVAQDYGIIALITGLGIAYIAFSPMFEPYAIIIPIVALIFRIAQIRYVVSKLKEK